MREIGKVLGLAPIDVIQLIEIEERINRNGVMSIEDFRAMLVYLPGLTTALTEAISMPIHEAIYFIKCKKYTSNLFPDLICEYKVKIGIKVI